MSRLMADYFCSDLHFFHKNILKYEPCRLVLGSTVEEMNWELVKCHNQVVTPEDHSWNLGDLSFQLEEKEVQIRLLVQAMHGFKTMVLGNHDKKPKEYYLSLGFDEVLEGPFLWKGVWISHYPVLKQKVLAGKLNIHGHLHSNNHRGEDSPRVNLHLYRNVSIECLEGFRPVKFEDVISG